MPAERPNYIVPQKGIGAGRHFLLLLSLAFFAPVNFPFRKLRKSSKRQELWVNSGNRNHEFELHTYSLRDSLTASSDSTAQFSRVTDIHLLLDSIPRSKRIWKKDFEYYLYRDFYAKAFIHSTLVHAVSDGTAYLSTRMNTLDSSRHALIWCSLEILENHLGELQVIRVQYPEE